jgi:signal transduction histidine kinase
VRSRSKNAHGAGTEAAQREPAGAGVLATAQQASPDRLPPGAIDPSANGHQRSGETQAAPRSTSRRALKNWRVRSRLFLLVIIPTVTAVALGGLRVASSVQSAEVYQRVGQLANLSGQITGLVQALQNERQDTVQYIVLNPDGRGNGLSSSRSTAAQAAPELAVLRQDYSITSGWATQASGLLRTIGSSYPALAQTDASSALSAITGLPDLRTAATRSQLPSLVVIQEYATVINALLAIDDQIAVGSNDSTLADTVRVAGLMSAIKEEVSEQQAILASAQVPDSAGIEQFGPSQQTAITNAEAAQTGNLAGFNDNATSSQRQLYHDAVSGTAVVNAQQQEQQAISVATSGQASAADPAIANASAAMSYLVTSLRSVERQLVDSVIARSKALRSNAITSVIVDSLAVLLVLALALIFTTIVGTSMVRPLRRLRTGALEVAGLRLPEAVRRMNETDGEAISPEVEPIDVDSTDEIGEVARAFDQVHREALRLASNEAALRGNVNAMFVNLSRRSQSLVERQIRLIDELEQGEQNSERLSSLFQMDHLATLMRRNSENLLVLAGHDVSRRWNKPVALVDVLRAAVSEIEQYERVTLNVQPGIAVRGQAVSDVVHLTAELVENATSFSPADTPVSIVGHLLSSGGVLLEIADQGVGMGAEEMAHANWRLDNPPVVDVAVSRRMGLFVVARLAARHSIRVRLRPAASGGLTALVWLPDEVVTHETPGNSMFPGRFDSTAVTGGGAGGSSGGTWGQADRSAAEQEVNAARAPRFAPLLADAGDTALGPRRVPGAGPMPGAGRWAATATGPLPAFRTSPQPGPQSAPRRDAEEFIPAPQPVAEAERYGTAPQPAVEAGHERDLGMEQAARTGAMPSAGFDSYHGEVGGSGSGPRPVISPEQRGGGPAADTGWGAQIGSSGTSGSGQRPVPAGPVGPVNGLGGSADGASRYDWGSGPGGGGVVVPPAAALGEANRLPIFEAVESDWFRRGRHAVSRSGREDWSGTSPGDVSSDSSPDSSSPDSGSWTSASDEGWRAAEAASAPSSGGVTSAGLPKRVPKANLVPGAVAETPATPAPALTRSAAATRERFSSFQRGIKEGRAIAGGDEPAGGEDESSR